MVNTGKPSRGCYMCRARRIKCDEAKPSCMRCQKSKRVCPGYRDAFELKLRDESKSTKKKLARRLSQNPSATDDVTPTDNQIGILPHSYSDPGLFYGDSRPGHSRHSSMSSVGSQDHFANGNNAMVSTHQQHNYITQHMTTPLHQQAACYFLANFVLVPKAGTIRGGYYDFVLPLMKNSNPPQTLLTAFSAVALAALGTRPNSKGLLPKADAWYLKALKEINTALKDPRVASTDSTLASAMLLASFEQLVPSKTKVGGWGSHIDGAVAVIKSRAPHEWNTLISRELFLAVRAHMVIHCIANSKAVDPGVDWMSVDSCDPLIERFAKINIKMAALRADNDVTTALKNHTAENIEKVLKLLRRAEALDQEYLDWVNNLPASWEIKTVAYIDGQECNIAESPVHPGRILAYGGLWMAYKYNTVRACRLMIWTSILRCVAWLGYPGDYRLTSEYTNASQVCRQLIEDIVASVPYFFGWSREHDVNMADKANFACGSGDSNGLVKGLSGIFIMWPMFAAISSDFTAPSQRIYLRGRLKYIAEIMGINQAHILLQAQLLHPSLFIARESANLPLKMCNEANDTEITIINGVATATTAVNSTLPLSPPMSHTLSATKQSWISPSPQNWTSPEHIPTFIPDSSWTSPTSQNQDLLSNPSWHSPPQSSQAWSSPTTNTSSLVAWNSPTNSLSDPHSSLASWNSPPHINRLPTSTSSSTADINGMHRANWASPPPENWSPMEEFGQPNWIPRTFIDPDFEAVDGKGCGDESLKLERSFKAGLSFGAK